MVEHVLKITEAALWLWKDKRSKKYLTAIYDLKKKIDNEYNKPEGEQDHAFVDKCRRDLLWLSDLAATEIRSENAPHKQK